MFQDGDGENDYVVNIASLPRQVVERQQMDHTSAATAANVQNGNDDDNEPVYEEMWGRIPANGVSAQNGATANGTTPALPQSNTTHAAAVCTPAPPPLLSRRSVSSPGQIGLPSYSPTTPTQPPPTWEDSFLDPAAPDVPDMLAPHSPPGSALPMYPIPPVSPPADQSDMMEDMSLFNSKMREAYGMDSSGGADAVGGWNSPPPTSQDAPPPYIGKKVLERNANKSLKLSQVEQLEKEIGNHGGVQVVLKKIDIYHAVALVDCFNGVW